MEKDREEPLGVVFVCGRDAACLQPWLALWRRQWPAAPLVLAEDVDDPLPAAPPDLATVPCRWRRGPRARAVLDALWLAREHHPGAEWIAKLDVDVAHLSRTWLEGARGGSELIGCQNGRDPAALLGMAFAMRRGMLAEVHASSDCADPGPEAAAIMRVARRRAPNDIWLWPHRPRDGGIFASMTAASKAPAYQRLFALVHCGVVARPAVADLLSSLAMSAPPVSQSGASI